MTLARHNFEFTDAMSNIYNVTVRDLVILSVFSIAVFFVCFMLFVHLLFYVDFNV